MTKSVTIMRNLETRNLIFSFATTMAVMAATGAGFSSSKPAFTPKSYISFSPRNLKSSPNKNVHIYSSPVDEMESYGVEGPRKKRLPRGAEDLVNPEEDLLRYLGAPEPIQSRAGLDGTVLVSGWVKSKERTDQGVFDLLNHEDAAFKFQHIEAFVDDMKFAKKRLLSRHARYTGLLDKLEFKQAEKTGSLPTVEQLQGVNAWVANVEVESDSPSEAVESVKAIAGIASQSSVKNVAVLLSNAAGLTDVAACVEAIKALDCMGDNIAFTVVAVGELDDKPEGSRAYEVSDFGTEAGVIPAGSFMSRDESLRLVTDCLALQSGADKALTFTEVFESPEENESAKLIKGLRQAGFTRAQEINHMIVAGVANYTKAVKEYKEKLHELENPDPEKARLEREEQERKDKEAFEKSQAEFEEKKKAEIEEIARSWAKREYFRKSMSGNMGMSEEEYIESVWDRAMFEGDLKYRMLHGGKTDERAELSEFMKKQEMKKEAALKRAREALEGQLGPAEDSPVGTVEKPDEDNEKDK